MSLNWLQVRLWTCTLFVSVCGPTPLRVTLPHHSCDGLSNTPASSPSAARLLSIVNVSPAVQHNGNFQPPATPQQLPEGAPASNSSLSEENQSQQPCQPPGQPPAPGVAQEGGGFMLSPTAPSLYGSAYSPFEKPPPYAC